MIRILLLLWIAAALSSTALSSTALSGTAFSAPPAPEGKPAPNASDPRGDADSTPGAGDRARVGTVSPWALSSDASNWNRRGGQQVWTHSLRFPGASFVKLRLSQLELRPGDSLEILAGPETGDVQRPVEVLRGRGPAGGDPFWTLASPGDTLELHLRAGAPYPRLPFRVGAVALGQEGWAEARGGEARGAGGAGTRQAQSPASWSTGLPWAPAQTPVAGARAAERSLCGPGDFEDAACYQGDAAKWANIRATAGILTIDGDSVFWCTGTNVSPRDYVLTTQSCLPDTAACRDAEIVFGYYRDGCGNGDPVAAGWTGYRCLETVATSPFDGQCEPDATRLDYSLVAVDGRPSNAWGYSDPSDLAVTSGEELYIPQHAGGRPLEIAHGDGADVVAEASILRYFGTLDTESSSVGAPIFAGQDHRLVGLHHCGGCSTAGVGNRGVPMTSLRPELAELLCSAAPLLEDAPRASLEPVSGNGDGVIDPGEVWSFVPSVRNPTCSGVAGQGAPAAVNASFAPAPGSAPIELLDTSSAFGAIEDGATVDGTPIRFRLAAGAPCAGQVEISLVEIGRGGETFAGNPEYLVAEVGETPTFPLLGVERFESGIPAGWSVVDSGTGNGPSSTWTTDDPGNRQLLDPPFAIVDSEHLGPDATSDEELITPRVDTTPYANGRLRFRHDFRWFDGSLDERADVEVRSSATAGAWTILASYSGADSRGLVELDLTPYSAPDLEVRFRYWNAEWEWWWAVDDVSVLGDDGRACFTGLWVDGFESGNLDAWSSHQP